MFARFPAVSLLLLLALCACASLGGPFGAPLSNRPPSVSGAYLQGRFAAQEFDIPNAETAFSLVAKQAPDVERNSAAFAYALASGSVAEAEDFARILLGRERPDEAEDETFEPEVSIQSDLPVFTLAAAAMREGDPKRAQKILDREFNSALGKSIAALLKSSAAYEQSGIAAATEAVQNQDERTFRGLVPLHAALLFVLEGEDQAAEAAFRQALSSPRAEIAAIAYGQLLERQGRGEDASTLYTRMVQDAGIYTRAGRMGLARIGASTDENKRFLRQAEAMPPLVEDGTDLFALTLENYAWLGFQQGISIPADAPLAEQRRNTSFVIPLALVNLARSLAPDRDASHYLAALIYGFFDNPEAAAAAAQDVRPSSWIYTYAVLEQAGSALDRGDDEEAARILRKAMKDDPGSPQWALQLHGQLIAAESYRSAEKAGTVAIDAAERLGVLPSSLWRYYFARGAGLQEEGVWDKARLDLEKALELAPDEPIILNHLGYSYVERGEQLERAFGMIERALDIQPDNGNIVDSLGWAHFQQGNYSDALEQLENAVELRPADAVITDHLGDVYFMLGRDRDARYEWQRVLTLDDADEDIRVRVNAKLRGDFSDDPVLASRGKGS